MKKLIFCFLVLLALSCATMQRWLHNEQWQPIECKDIAYENIWQIAKQAIQHNNFIIEEEDYVAGTMVSKWDNQLSPYHKDESRQRAYMRCEPLGDFHFRLEFRVEVYTNANMAGTMNVEAGDWQLAADNVGRAQRMVQYVRSSLRHRPSRSADKTVSLLQTSPFLFSPLNCSVVSSKASRVLLALLNEHFIKSMAFIRSSAEFFHGVAHQVIFF